MEHFDETGRPCTRHPAANHDAVLALALLGSRTPSFHHDVAAKLQLVMMSLDDLQQGALDEDQRSLVTTAFAAARDIQELFAQDRVLARPPVPAPVALDELVAAAARRAGVAAHGKLPGVQVAVSAPAIAHAIALVLDVAAGPSERGRAIGVSATVRGAIVLLAVDAVPDPPRANAGELLAIASFALDRERGELRCNPTSFALRLPLHE